MAGSNAVVSSGLMTPPPTPRLLTSPLAVIASSSISISSGTAGVPANSTTSTTSTASSTGTTTVAPVSTPQPTINQLTYLESLLGWEMVLGVEEAIRDG